MHPDCGGHPSASMVPRSAGPGGKRRTACLSDRRERVRRVPPGPGEPLYHSARARRVCAGCSVAALASAVWLFQISEPKRIGAPAQAGPVGFRRRSRISRVATLSRSYGYCLSARTTRSAASPTETRSAQGGTEVPWHRRGPGAVCRAPSRHERFCLLLSPQKSVASAREASSETAFEFNSAPDAGHREPAGGETAFKKTTTKPSSHHRPRLSSR